MANIIKSSSANILPFISGIPAKYWKQWVVSGGSVLLTGNPSIELEYLYMMVYSPNPGTVSYTGDMQYPQFSEEALGAQYHGQCSAFAKAVCDVRSIPTSSWIPYQSLEDFMIWVESYTPNSYQWLMIACFDNKPNYALADATRKHVAMIVDIIRFPNGKPKAIVVIDQNYYNFNPYKQYRGKIAKHIIVWGTPGQKWVWYARNYHIVGI